MRPVISHQHDRSRYEATVEDTLAGFAVYALRDHIIDFSHTEVEPAFEGKGIASTLIKHALNDVRAQGDRTVVASCPFVAEWIERHPDYHDLLA